MYQLKPRSIDDLLISVTDTATLLYSLVDTASSAQNSKAYYGNERSPGDGVANVVSLRPEDGDIRVISGATPTATKGFLIKAGTRYFYHGELQNLKLVRTGSHNVSVGINFWRGERGESIFGNSDLTGLPDNTTAVSRASLILTNSYVATSSISAENATQLTIYSKYTKGSLTSVEIMVEFSIDGSTWFQETNSAIATGTSTLSLNEYTYTGATGNFTIRVPFNATLVKVSAKGTGTVTNSLLELTTVLSR
jgi:hypothetical protein